MPALPPLRLGVNIDHVATVRNARGAPTPDPLRAARAGRRGRRRRHHRPPARGSPPHRRRRHRPPDGRHRPAAQLRDGGDRGDGGDRAAPPAARRLHRAREARGAHHRGRARRGRPAQSPRSRWCARLGDAGIRVSLFIEADPRQLEAAVALGAPVVELHTGAYCEIAGADAGRRAGAHRRRPRRCAAQLGLECHAGHGLNYDNVGPIAAIPNVRELNIGHFLIGEAIFVGLEPAIREMRAPDGRRARRGGGVIIGLGNDLIDIRRIEKSLERFGERFVQRIFTEIEQKRSEGRATRAASYAKRFAAKEACAKALGTGLRRGVFWRDMGVVNLRGGKPTMALTGGALARLQRDHAGRNVAADRPHPHRRISHGPGDRDHFGRASGMSERAPALPLDQPRPSPRRRRLISGRPCRRAAGGRRGLDRWRGRGGAGLVGVQPGERHDAAGPAARRLFLRRHARLSGRPRSRLRRYRRRQRPRGARGHRYGPQCDARQPRRRPAGRSDRHRGRDRVGERPGLAAGTAGRACRRSSRRTPGKGRIGCASGRPTARPTRSCARPARARVAATPCRRATIS